MKEIDSFLKEHDKNLQEVEEARKDYRGNINKSLEDRLNADQDEIYNRFNNATLLPYSDKYITAENSYKGRTSDLVLKGRTLQNLFRNNTIIEGTESGDFFYCLNIHKIENLKGKTLTFFNVTDRIIQYDSRDLNNNPGGLSFIVDPHSIKVATIDKDVKIYDVLCKTINGWTEANKGELKGFVLEGDWTNKPTPSYFEGIKSVCETGETLQVKSCGKNLFDGIMELGYLNKGNNIPSNSNTRSKNFIPIKPNKQYHFSQNGNCKSINLSFYDSNFSFIKEDTAYIFIPPSNSKYIRFYYATGFENTSNLQLEEGTTATQYEPYTEDKTDLLKDLNLRGLDDTIRDTLDSKGVLTRNVGKTILNGSENSGLINSTMENTIKFTVADIVNIKYINIYKLICNNFNSGINIVTSDTEGIRTASTSNAFYISVLKSRLTGYSDSLSDTEKVNLFKAWLKANPVTVCYQLATPIVEKIEGMKELNTYDKVTHIFQEGSLISPTIQCKVPSNVQVTIATLKLENKALAVENTALKNSVEDNTLTSIETSVNQEERLTMLEMGVK